MMVTVMLMVILLFVIAVAESLSSLVGAESGFREKRISMVRV